MAGLVIKFIDKRSKAARKSSFSLLSSGASDDIDATRSGQEDNTSNSNKSDASNTKSKKGKTSVINNKKDSSSKKSLLATASSVATDAIPSSTTATTTAGSLASEEDTAPRVEVYKHEGGIIEMVKTLCADKTNLHSEVDIISFSETR